MRSIRVTLSPTTSNGQFRVAMLSRESGGSLPVDTDTWNLVTQVLRLMEKPEVRISAGFPYSFPFAFEPEK